MPGEDQATLNTGLDSSAMQQLDPQENPGGEDVVSTIGDEVGGIDVSSGGTHAQPKEETGGEAEQGKAGEEKAGGEKKAGKEEKGAKPAGGEEKSEGKTKDDKPFHEHPDWQRMIKERNDARDALKQATDEIAQIKEQIQTFQGGDKGVEAELLKMDEDELRELFDDEPKKFVSLLINTLNQEMQTRETTAKTAAEQEELSRGIDATYEAFEKEHPDFTEKWNQGVLQEFMSKHPGHTPISAYLALDHANFEQRVKDEAAKKEKEIEDRIRREYRAKVRTDVLGDGPASTPSGEDDEELKHPERYGGLTAVQARRLERMRAQG